MMGYQQMGKGWPDVFSELRASWDKDPLKSTIFLIVVLISVIVGVVAYGRYTKPSPTQTITAPGDNNVNTNTNNGTIKSTK